MSEWIPVSEGLPDDYGLFIITTIDMESHYPFEKHVYTSDYSPNDGWDSEDSVMRVIAWQPLPEPYRG